METSTYTRIHTTVRLDRTEEWVTRTKDNNGFDFFVQRVIWDGDDQVTLAGNGRKRSDGSRAYIDRSTWERFDDLPADIRLALAESRRATIVNLYHLDKEGPLS